jgi:cytidine deaminase
MRDLESKAEAVKSSAHAPYSEFPVGAALETRSGEIFTGCNIETGNIKNSFHAEEVALVDAVKHGHREFSRLASTTVPCGKCRQSFAEFCDDEFEITYQTEDGKWIVSSLAELLPARGKQRG